MCQGSFTFWPLLLGLFWALRLLRVHLTSVRVQVSCPGQTTRLGQHTTWP